MSLTRGLNTVFVIVPFICFCLLIKLQADTGSTHRDSVVAWVIGERTKYSAMKKIQDYYEKKCCYANREGIAIKLRLLSWEDAVAVYTDANSLEKTIALNKKYNFCLRSVYFFYSLDFY